MAKGIGGTGRSGRTASVASNAPRTSAEFVSRLNSLSNAGQVSRIRQRSDRLLSRAAKQYGVDANKAQSLNQIVPRSQYVSIGNAAYEVVSHSQTGTVTLRPIAGKGIVNINPQEAQSIKAVSAPKGYADRYGQLASRNQVARNVNVLHRTAGNQRVAAYRTKYGKAFSRR